MHMELSDLLAVEDDGNFVGFAVGMELMVAIRPSLKAVR